jgi:hypothetical protein
MATGHHDQGGIPVLVATDAPVAIHQSINFMLYQVLPAATLSISDPPWRTCFLQLSHKGLEMGKYVGDTDRNSSVIGVTKPDPDLSIAG